jgi:WD40 repeat protein
MLQSQKIREFTHAFKDPPLSADAGVWPAAIAIAPDGKTIATSWFYLRHGPMYTIRVGHGVSLWDVATGKELPIDTALASNLAFVDGGKTLVCADGESGFPRKDPARDKNAMEFWDVATGKKVRGLPGPAEWGGVLAFSPNGNFFASAGSSNHRAVNVWRTATGERIKQFVGHTRAIECLVFSPDGRMLASGSRDTTILLWEVLQLR